MNIYYCLWHLGKTQLIFLQYVYSKTVWNCVFHLYYSLTWAYMTHQGPCAGLRTDCVWASREIILLWRFVLCSIWETNKNTNFDHYNIVLLVPFTNLDPYNTVLLVPFTNLDLYNTVLFVPFTNLDLYNTVLLVLFTNLDSQELRLIKTVIVLDLIINNK